MFGADAEPCPAPPVVSAEDEIAAVPVTRFVRFCPFVFSQPLSVPDFVTASTKRLAAIALDAEY